VLARYQHVFAFDRIPEISEEEFRGFLRFENNRHWTGLARAGASLCEDMSHLRDALAILLDESRSIKDRFDQLLPKSGPPFMKKFGKALATAILHVTHPDKYGVYNGTSEAGMKAVGVFPEFDRGSAFSDRYLEVNRILGDLASRLQIDLWTLDSLWWGIKRNEEREESIVPAPQLHDEAESQIFGLERHLHDFLYDNWSRISLGKEWDLYEEDGEIVGYEYNTNEIGKIDLLAKHKSQPRWLVIELKRQQTSDDTVGQVLRYMGWVGKQLASEAETVQGLIIAHEADAKIEYALTHAKNVGFMRYSVDFHLQEVPGVAALQL